MKPFYKLLLVLGIIMMVFLAGCSSNEKAIATAVANGDTAKVQSLLDKGVSPNLKTEDGKSLLMLASYLGHADIAKLLIDKGADVNAKDQDGKTALIYAAEKGHLEVAQLLLKSGADPNSADNNGRTALMYAAEKGYLEIAKLLLENGADLNAVDRNGKTALQIARDNNQAAMVDLLSNWGKKAVTETPVATAAPETAAAPTPEAPVITSPQDKGSLNKQLSSIFFDFDKSVIRDDQAKALTDNLAILKDNPNLYVVLGAHADERGSRDYNIDLSAQRAAVVKKYLTGRGVAGDHFVVYAYGKDHPLKTGHDEASHSYNRRVDILMWDTKLSGDQVLTETIK